MNNQSTNAGNGSNLIATGANEFQLNQDIVHIKIAMTIITGNSETMRKKTISILDHHKFKWMIMAHNLGEIIVTG